MGRVERSEPWTSNLMSRVVVFMFTPESSGLMRLRFVVNIQRVGIMSFRIFSYELFVSVSTWSF